MRAYSMDLRERALLDSDAGMKAADVAAKYRVSGSWVRLLKQRRRETGEVAPRVQRHGRRCMLEPHLHTLAALIAAQPDRTLAELKDALATPARVPTVWRAVRALGLTVKKNGPPVRTRSADVAARGLTWHAARPTTSCFWTRHHQHSASAVRPGTAWRARPDGRRPAVARRVAGHGADPHRGSSTARSMADHRPDLGADPAPTATSSSPTTSGPTRSPASSGPSRPPGPPSGTCHPTARTSIPSSSASRSSRPSFAPHAVAAARHAGRSSASAWRTSALTNAATIFGTAGTRPPHGHEKRFNSP